jgi:HEAT repeat protein
MLLVGLAAASLTLLFTTQTARAAWQELAVYLGLVGPVERVSANVLSEHEIEALDGMPPQSQAQLLLERTINHFSGASAQIAARVDGWRGKITLDDRLNGLFTTALNSDDLRVRAAAIEVDIAARGLEKTSATVDRLQSNALEGEQGPRVNALWDIALLGNRGVEPDRAFRLLMTAIDDANVNVRYWAVEGLSYLGTDATIEPLLNVFHNDASPMIRERAACSLAQSGMLSEKQRRTAVPRLLDYADDPSLDAETRKWVYQALRDITGQDLPHESAAWRTWYHAGGANWRPVTRDGRE